MLIEKDRYIGINELCIKWIACYGKKKKKKKREKKSLYANNLL